MAAHCSICSDARRDPTMVCVVEDPRDIVAVERTREFQGRYHVLGGALNPIEGVGPEQLRVRELLARIDAEGITEVILCTNPNLEGDTTAMYLARLLEAARAHGDPDRERAARRRRPRIRRRAHARASTRGTARGRRLKLRSPTATAPTPHLE